MEKKKQKQNGDVPFLSLSLSALLVSSHSFVEGGRARRGYSLPRRRWNPCWVTTAPFYTHTYTALHLAGYARKRKIPNPDWRGRGLCLVLPCLIWWWVDGYFNFVFWILFRVRVCRCDLLSLSLFLLEVADPLFLGRDGAGRRVGPRQDWMIWKWDGLGWDRVRWVRMIGDWAVWGGEGKRKEGSEGGRSCTTPTIFSLD